MKRFAEWKEATQEERVFLERCRDAIREIDPNARVILYGSRARNDADLESDYDLLVLVDGDVDLKREDLFRRRLFPIEIETGHVFTVIVYNRDEWGTPLYRAMPFCQNVEKDSVIL